ncbi:unnamed protein product [Alopecurus aequalis]
MAPPPLPKERNVRLPENEELAGRLLEKHRSMMAEQPGGLSENLELVLSAAYRGLCASKHPIRTPADLLRTKGVGPWVVRILKDSFPTESSADLSPQEGKTRKYVPRKNSAAYSIVITLYREMISGKHSMMKQDLIDAAEASGLPNNSRVKPGNSRNDWYTGWSCIKTLISKALVVKWSNPAKYMLTEEGKKTARDCLARSGLDDTAGPSTHHSVEVILSDSDSDEPYPCYSDSDEPAERQGSAGNSLLAMSPRYSNRKFQEAYEVVLILDD